MPFLRNLLHGFAFLLGWLCFFNLALDLLAAATFARLSYGTADFFAKQQRQVDSWFDVLTGLAADLGWICLAWLLSIVVYRSSDRILAATGNGLAKLFRHKPRLKTH